MTDQGRIALASKVLLADAQCGLRLAAQVDR